VRSSTRKPELPSVDELIGFIRESPATVGVREIAREFAVGQADRPRLRAMLRDVERAGAIARAANRRFVASQPLPEVTVVERFGSDEDGIALARPVSWSGPDPAPVLRLVENGEAEQLRIGERAATRLVALETGDV
jgi:ribonuclease R